MKYRAEKHGKTNSRDTNVRDICDILVLDDTSGGRRTNIGRLSDKRNEPLEYDERNPAGTDGSRTSRDCVHAQSGRCTGELHGSGSVPGYGILHSEQDHRRDGIFIDLYRGRICSSSQSTHVQDTVQK